MTEQELQQWWLGLTEEQKKEALRQCMSELAQKSLASRRKNWGAKGVRELLSRAGKKGMKKRWKKSGDRINLP